VGAIFYFICSTQKPKVNHATISAHMHAVHHTEAFILRVRPAGEANIRVWLFTRDFGLVIAVVQGVRKQGAKLQMQLSEYSYISVDLVRGRDVWRLVSAVQIEAPLLLQKKIKRGRIVVRTLTAVERFCHGEEVNLPLFEHLQSLFACFDDKDVDASSLDTVSLWRVMVHLGYSSAGDDDGNFLDMPLSDAARILTPSKRKSFIKNVGETIAQTHL
jgi:recombinational DNA repair protein (RecF pathway)